MIVADVMVSNVITVGPQASVQELADILFANRISAVPVVGEHGDMQRCCSECIAKRRCAGDLDASDDSRWQGYCPNAETLALLKSLKLHR